MENAMLKQLPGKKTLAAAAFAVAQVISITPAFADAAVIQINSSLPYG